MLTPLPGLISLWEKTRGDPRVTLAILDGPVDLSHPCFNGAQLTSLPTLVSGQATPGFATQHGTHVASVIFGQPESSVRGIAPRCRGLIVPVFTEGSGEKLAPCSQIDLARAITQAVAAGANVINISGGQLTAAGESDRLLTNAIRFCQENHVLIVAAAGNDGCECLHIPAALASVLAVGAMDAQGQPLEFSNWGTVYQSQGLLAPGENILGAKPGGGTVRRSGTSFATPIVSGIVALLLSLQRQRGQSPDPDAIREALLQSAVSCQWSEGLEPQRCLMGRLNLSGIDILLKKGGIQAMSENKAMDIPAKGITPLEGVLSLPEEMATVTPSACGSGGGKAQLAYALGELGTDFGSEARRDSFTQAMNSGMSLLDYLAANPWAAQSLIWTLNLDATPIYAIVPMGPFANVTYERLRTFLADTEVERVSIPGYVGGSVKLMSGQTVPVIVPEVRGMYSWSVSALSKAVMGKMSLPAGVTEAQVKVKSRIEDYLNRIYYDYRNLGVTPQERALNFSATNAFQASVAILEATGDARVLDKIAVEKSPICRPESDCYDVKLSFFDPENKQRSRRVYRFTVDVSEVMPVTIGKVRSWSQA